jgi:hypothetical protein
MAAEAHAGTKLAPMYTIAVHKAELAVSIKNPNDKFASKAQAAGLLATIDHSDCNHTQDNLVTSN